MLRIASSQVYQQAAKAIGDRQIALAKVQRQLATGNRISNPSDDPVGSARLLKLNDELGRYDQYQRNIDLAAGRLNIEDATLEDTNEILQRARELTLQASNDTLNAGDRRNIAKEISQLHSKLLNVANTQDGNGEYLFAGFKSQTRPFDSSGNYQGDGGQRLVKAGPNLDIAVGDPGAEVFQTNPSDSTTGLFAILNTLASAMENPLATFHDTMAAGLTALDQGLDKLNEVRTKVGVRLKALEDQEYANSDFTLHLKQTISDLGDVDYAEAATRLSQESLGLQVAQQSFMRIQNLSLFNYIR